MTGYVVTRWYRAPEVILNWMHYTQTGEALPGDAAPGSPSCSAGRLLSWAGAGQGVVG